MSGCCTSAAPRCRSRCWARTKPPKVTQTISNYRALREALGLNQSEFWAKVGVTQSGGSRYESGRHVPKPTAVLAHCIYVAGKKIDARTYA